MTNQRTFSFLKSIQVKHSMVKTSWTFDWKQGWAIKVNRLSFSFKVECHTIFLYYGSLVFLIWRMLRSGGAFASHAGDRGLISSRNRFKSLKREWQLYCQTLGIRCECHRSWPLLTDASCDNRCGTLKNYHCSMAMSAEYSSDLYSPSPEMPTSPNE